MKKIFSTLLGIALIGSISFASSDISSEDIKLILTGMDIVDYNVSDNSQVTRKELAEILVKSSTSAELGKGTIRMSTFPDVPYDYENASYIRLAALNGYLTAYSDGEFKPDNIVKNEEAITTMLKLLGYKSSDFTQSYPYEQLTIANSLGITDGVNTTIGSAVTQKDLQRLIYNTLNCNTKGSNQKYVNTLGYSVSDDITLSDVMTKNISGPVTYMSSLTLADLTGLENPVVYIDGKLGNKEDLSYYDILYYSKNSGMIWAYTNKVTGILESISPNKEAPTEVSISGKTYKLSTYSAKKAFGVDGLEVGNMVTLLLDRNGNVADSYLTEDLYVEQVGVIISAGKKSLMTTDGTEKTSYYAEILLSSGEKLDIATNSNYSEKIGYAARISYNNGKVSIYSTKKTLNIYGKFNLANKTLGNEKISENINILEIDDYGNVATIYANDIDGMYLSKEQVVLVTKNDDDVIENMIIKEVTGDTLTYGILTDINEDEKSASYVCIVDGNEKSYSNSDVTFNIEEGPVAIGLDGQSLEGLYNLEKVAGNIVNINNSYMENYAGEKLNVASDVAVYYKNSSNYYLYSMEEAMSGEYNVSAYCDKLSNKVRIIILSK